MALKDWKKIGKEVWERKSSLQNQEFYKLWINRKSKGYVVIYVIGFPASPRIYKETKTKLQALKFAKSYMRKH